MVNPTGTAVVVMCGILFQPVHVVPGAVRYGRIHNVPVSQVVVWNGARTSTGMRDWMEL